MAERHRLNGQQFTCANDRFRTDTDNGRSDRARGSVFAGPLFENDQVSLWLERVHDTHQPSEPFYWLMWYDARGNPTIPLSGVMSAKDVKAMVGRLAEFMDLH